MINKCLPTKAASTWDDAGVEWCFCELGPQKTINLEDSLAGEASELSHTSIHLGVWIYEVRLGED